MKTLVCLHAAISGPGTWDTVRPGLEALGYQVVCPTLLGHENAVRRDAYPLAAFRDQVVRDLEGVDRFTLVGHSLGAFIASLVAQQYPDRVERLILEEMPVPPRDAQDSSPARTAAGPVMRVLARLSRRSYDPVMFRQVLAELQAPRPEWWTDLPKITAPTLLLAGGSGSHLDQSRFDLVAKSLPAASITEVPVGHRIHSKAPERWMGAVRDFLEP
ncbi:alpha/beta hydrolase [Kribbella lupini]|uniref:AB hydrolase-1 domain-containing protein n=1 Tax=Kribbella lupini TaxID=291602 RepID=A0ABP4KT14_9ACTN